MWKIGSFEGGEETWLKMYGWEKFLVRRFAFLMRITSSFLSGLTGTTGS
jgi:hypothetical protein